MGSGRLGFLGTIGVLSIGDMGQAVARRLQNSGFRIITTLEGRTERTAALARRAGVPCLPRLADVIRESDIVLSLVPPSQAMAVARNVAVAASVMDTQAIYVESNSVSPRTAAEVAAILATTGLRIVDACIIGGRPRPEGDASEAPRFYASGPYAREFAKSCGRAIDIRVLDDGVGRASGLKMCYDALLKTTVAVAAELLVAAERLGVASSVYSELSATEPALLDFVQRRLPQVPPKAQRWVGEMHEIGTAFEDVGLPRQLVDGVGDVCAFIAASELGRELPEARSMGTTAEAVVDLLARTLHDVER